MHLRAQVFKVVISCYKAQRHDPGPSVLPEDAVAALRHFKARPDCLTLGGARDHVKSVLLRSGAHELISATVLPITDCLDTCAGPLQPCSGRCRTVNCLRSACVGRRSTSQAHGCCAGAPGHVALCAARGQAERGGAPGRAGAGAGEHIPNLKPDWSGQHQGFGRGVVNQARGLAASGPGVLQLWAEQGGAPGRAGAGAGESCLDQGRSGMFLDVTRSSLVGSVALRF